MIAQPQKLCQQSHSKFYLIESSPVLGEELAGIGAASCVMGDGVCRAGLAPEGLLQRLAGHWLQASFAWMSIRDRPFVQASAAWFTVDIAEIFRSFFKWLWSIFVTCLMCFSQKKEVGQEILLSLTFPVWWIKTSSHFCLWCKLNILWKYCGIHCGKGIRVASLKAYILGKDGISFSIFFSYGIILSMNSRLEFMSIFIAILLTQNKKESYRWRYHLFCPSR